MSEQGLNYLLINSTNKYLVEYSRLEENSRYKLTGFSGSTGDALITPDTIFLFVDGRYHIQADLEVDHNIVTVVKLQTGQTFLDELVAKIPSDEVLGIFSKKNSQKRVEYLINKGLKLKYLSIDPFDEDLKYDNSNIEKVDGISVEDKLKNIDKTILVTNLEEVSYLFNLRDFSENYSSKIQSKAVILNGKARLIDDIDDFVECYDGEIWVDKSTINAYDFALIGDKAKVLVDSPIKLMKSVKTPDEIVHYKEAFRKTDLAVKAIRTYIEANDNLSEYDIANQLEKEFKRFGAKSLSFKSIVAKDKNSALAHYSKCSKDEIIKDGSLVLIDCGAYYEQGLATDITRVFVKGKPTELQKRVYTTVLKMFLNAYNMQAQDEKFIGFDIDEYARKIYSQNKIDGFVFNHGLGHGIGVSVHEYPPNLSKNEMAKVEIKDGMCFTIEPGLYNEKHFGIRLENSCYLENGQIKSFVKMNYEKKLIDFFMLNEQEKQWLSEFEVI
jgi:Xaa-Pro aminopeptidase